MRDALLAVPLIAPLVVGIIWIPMLAEDTLSAARVMAAEIADRRVRHFYDAQRRAGKAIAKMLGGAGETAWDTYLFYEDGEVWQSQPPTPTRWTHQLTDCQWIDAKYLRTGALLHQTIGYFMQSLTAEHLRRQPVSTLGQRE